MASVNSFTEAQGAFLEKDEYQEPDSACNCASASVLAVAKDAGMLLCSEMPWWCPRKVLPTCNTGVHRQVKGARQLALSSADSTQRCDE